MLEQRPALYEARLKIVWGTQMHLPRYQYGHDSLTRAGKHSGASR
jgi:hypothetical protein